MATCRLREIAYEAFIMPSERTSKQPEEFVEEDHHDHAP
jgi:hypothetical protein